MCVALVICNLCRGNPVYRSVSASLGCEVYGLLTSTCVFRNTQLTVYMTTNCAFFFPVMAQFGQESITHLITKYLFPVVYTPDQTPYALYFPHVVLQPDA